MPPKNAGIPMELSDAVTSSTGVGGIVAWLPTMMTGFFAAFTSSAACETAID